MENDEGGASEAPPMGQAGESFDFFEGSVQSGLLRADFLEGQRVELVAHPGAEVFTVLGKVEHPEVEGLRYLAAGSSGATVLLRANEIRLAIEWPAHDEEPELDDGVRVRIVTDALPNLAPRGTTGAVLGTWLGYVDVQFDDGSSVPMRVDEIALLDTETSMPVFANGV
ncbi:hypothetical protein JNUCC0626_40325 [Lentzea sp. JNUCC 0626]|uniref:hypothetical protein n=1 Tax=Lentzea sp. JNUCC 0626 TaxID=3367513 RepID=UPI00374A8EEB